MPNGYESKSEWQAKPDLFPKDQGPGKSGNGAKRALMQQEETRLRQSLKRSLVQEQTAATQNQAQKPQPPNDPSFVMNPKNVFNAAKDKFHKAYLNFVDKQKFCDEAQAKLQLLHEAQTNQEKRMTQLNVDIQKTQSAIYAYQKLNLPKQASYRKDLAKQQSDIRETMQTREQTILEIRMAMAHLQATHTQIVEAQQELEMALQMFQEAQRMYEEDQQRLPTTTQPLQQNQGPIASEVQEHRQQVAREDFWSTDAFQRPVTTQTQITQAVLQQQTQLAQGVQPLNPMGGRSAIAGNEEDKEGEELRKAEVAVLNAQHQLLQARDAEKASQQKMQQIQTQIHEEMTSMAKKTAEAQKNLDQAEIRRSQIKDTIAAARSNAKAQAYPLQNI